MAPSDQPIILYHYTFSPYAKRIVWYLALREIPYSECLQPLVLPRPDIAQLGIAYRRIPLLSIGRDVYADTRLILQKLDQLYPPSEAHPPIAARTGDQRAIEGLLSRFVIDGGVFARAAQLIPTSLPVISDPTFLKDRADMLGAPSSGPSPFSKDVMDARRPEALQDMRGAMELLETTLLADGRDWILGGEGPTLADIEAVWVFHWLNSMPGALPSDVMGPKQFPRLFIWIERFTKTLDMKAQQLPKPNQLNGDEAAALILKSAYAEPEGTVDRTDVVVASEAIKKGDTINMWPTDSGANHKDTGKAIAVTASEAVVETNGSAGSVRLHAPRHGFKIQSLESRQAKSVI